MLATKAPNADGWYLKALYQSSIFKYHAVMNKMKSRPWTDEDMGYIAATLDLPAKKVAATLGRLPHQVDQARARYRRGLKGKQWWSSEEDAVILESAYKTAKEVAAILPGRSTGSVNHRRRTLSAACMAASAKNPLNPDTRTVIARTCRTCGLLLPANWYGTYKDRLKADCRKCLSGKAVDRKKRSGRDQRAANAQRSDRAYERAAQAISLETATKYRDEYTEADHAVLSDPTLTNLRKALLLSRTYSAVATQVSRNGYKSFRGIGDPKRDQWVIYNPNLDRIEEIRATVESTTRELETAGAPKRPDFEWDD